MLEEAHFALIVQRRLVPASYAEMCQRLGDIQAELRIQAPLSASRRSDSAHFSGPALISRAITLLDADTRLNGLLQGRVRKAWDSYAPVFQKLDMPSLPISWPRLALSMHFIVRGESVGAALSLRSSLIALRKPGSRSIAAT